MYIVYVNVDDWRFRNRIAYKRLMWKSFLTKEFMDLIHNMVLLFFWYVIKFTPSSSLPILLWCSSMTLRACVDRYQIFCADILDVDIFCLLVACYLCAWAGVLAAFVYIALLKWLFVCMCVSAGMPENEIKTETIWMNKLHYAEDKWKIF